MEKYNFMVIHEPAVDPLELRLGSLVYGFSPSCSGADVSGSGHEDSSKQLLDEQRRKITFFYNGRISFSDVTNFQARVIIDMANKEMDDSKYNMREEEKEATARGTMEVQPGLSMKRSLQRFLQKRKTRMADHSFPYAHRKPLQLF